MKDKLRKFVERTWYFKERIVFITMVGILCWHVYRGYNAPAEQAMAPHPYPSDTSDITPPAPPERPPAPTPGQWRAVFTPNPFWYTAAGGAASGQAGTQDAGIKLLDIQEANGRLRAQLQTSTVTKWYNEGAKFESFELLSIDPAGSCQIYSEQSGKVIELTLPGA